METINSARRLVMIVILGVGFSLMCASAQNLPSEAKTAGEVWLFKDCGVGEQDQLSSVLRKFKPQFESFFLDALRKGPPPQLLLEVEAVASKRFDLRQDALKTGKGLGLSDANLEALRRTTREEYLREERDDFVVNYKSKAVSGLGIVAGDIGRTALQAFAADQNSPLRDSAIEALGQLKLFSAKESQNK